MLGIHPGYCFLFSSEYLGAGSKELTNFIFNKSGLHEEGASIMRSVAEIVSLQFPVVVRAGRCNEGAWVSLRPAESADHLSIVDDIGCGLNARLAL